ncbi:MAG: hypothetical protein JNM18_25070 [Planctomycetaceae bacterium]|nr:hypothetical protein [Planctomycetaceae bacterium]
MLDLTCACCGYKTVQQDYEICSLCGWEWDHAEVSHPIDMSGANGMPLFEAQRIWKEFVDSGGVRKPPRAMFTLPGPRFVKDPEWQPFVPLPYSFYLNGQRAFNRAWYASKKGAVSE